MCSLSFERKGTKRETNCRINKHAPCPRASLDESNRERRGDPPPPPFLLEGIIYQPRCCDSRSSWAVVPGRTSPRRLGWSCYPCSRTDRALLWWWWSVLKRSFFSFFFYFFWREEQNIKIARGSELRLIISIFYFWHLSL